jgi:hypothetical protein
MRLLNIGLSLLAAVTITGCASAWAAATMNVPKPAA